MKPSKMSKIWHFEVRKQPTFSIQTPKMAVHAIHYTESLLSRPISGSLNLSKLAVFPGTHLAA